MSELLSSRKTIALVAHDNCKADLVEWADYNRHRLADHSLVATGTTGNILEHELGLPVRRLLSGPIGGDQQIGALLADPYQRRTPDYAAHNQRLVPAAA